MSRMPRILPLTAVAIGGVLAINAIARGPDLLSAAKAFAEDVGPAKAASPAPAVAPDASIAAPAAKPAPVCAPTAAQLAQEAGLSPAELQVLQSLGARRGELDQREADLDTQVNLMAAAEAKLDARIQQMNGLKGDIQALLGQADQQQQADTDRLVRVYEAMPPKDAAARMALMDDSVRLPIAEKMKERVLAAILAKMQPEDAKDITEKLAQRTSGSQVLDQARAALNPPATPAPASPPPAQAAQGASQAGQSAQNGSNIADDAAASGATSTPGPKPGRHKRLAKARPAHAQALASAAPAPSTGGAKASPGAASPPGPAAKAG